MYMINCVTSLWSNGPATTAASVLTQLPSFLLQFLKGYHACFSICISDIRKAKNGVCPSGTTQNLLLISLAPCYLSQAALWAYSGTGSGTPPGHTQILRPRNLWHISVFQGEFDGKNPECVLDTLKLQRDRLKHDSNNTDVISDLEMQQMIGAIIGAGNKTGWLFEN